MKILTVNDINHQLTNQLHKASVPKDTLKLVSLLPLQYTAKCI
jgi:hypothetical protein